MQAASTRRLALRPALPNLLKQQRTRAVCFVHRRGVRAAAASEDDPYKARDAWPKESTGHVTNGSAEGVRATATTDISTARR